MKEDKPTDEEKDLASDPGAGRTDEPKNPPLKSEDEDPSPVLDPAHFHFSADQLLGAKRTSLEDLSPEKANLSGITKVGFILTKRVLWIMVGALVVSYLWLILSKTPISPLDQALRELLAQKKGALDAETLTTLKELSTLAHEQTLALRKGKWDFWINSVTLIVQTILLPVLTALLGYIFGTRESSEPDNSAGK